MANSQTKHSIELRRATRAQHAERVRTEGVRIDVSLLDSDGMDYVPRMKQLIADHGTAPAALRFLLDFYGAKKEDTSVHP